MALRAWRSDRFARDARIHRWSADSRVQVQHRSWSAGRRNAHGPQRLANCLADPAITRTEARRESAALFCLGATRRRAVDNAPNGRQLASETFPDFLQTLHADRHWRSQLLREQRYTELFEQPAKFIEPFIGYALPRRDFARVRRLQLCDLTQTLGVAGGIGLELVEPHCKR